jgi:hypothetical protein
MVETYSAFYYLYFYLFFVQFQQKTKVSIEKVVGYLKRDINLHVDKKGIYGLHIPY